MPHIHKLIDFIVASYIIHNNKVLLINHKELNMWLPIGGHIELDENPEEALFREIEEEAGLKRKDLKVLSEKPKVSSQMQKFLYTPNLLDIHQVSDTHKHIGITYFLKSNTDKVQLNNTEHHSIRWFTKAELHNKSYNIKKHIIYIAERAIDSR